MGRMVEGGVRDNMEISIFDNWVEISIILQDGE